MKDGANLLQSLKETIDDVAEAFTEHTFGLVYKTVGKRAKEDWLRRLSADSIRQA